MHANKMKFEAHTPKESPTPPDFTSDQKACLQSLQFPEMYWRKNDVADPARATCTWILEHKKYCEWLDQGHGLLWIKGKPGAGKSTVLKHALETSEREIKQDVILASYFFHGRGMPIQKNILGLFRSLLHQILQQNCDLLSKFTFLYKKKCDTEGPCGIKWNWHERQLETFFKSSVVDTAKRHTIRIYIDALDECGQNVALDLVEFFRCFATPVSICFSCRHYPFVALESGNEVCVENENAQDIEVYIQDKIEAHIQQTKIAMAIRDEIVSRSAGNFQWVVLVVPQVIKLHKSRNPLATIQIMIRNTPAELKDLYTELLDSIEEHEKVHCLRFMQWISFAFEPLTLRQLRFALAVNADTSHTSVHQCQNSELYVETDEDMERRVFDLSKGLAEVLEKDGHSIVQFIHQSVNDFLLEKGLQILDNSSAGTVVGRGHFWLSRSCIQFLSMREFQGFAASVLDMGEDGEVDMVKEEKKDYFAFLEYSVRSWLLHASFVEDANMPQEDLAALNFKPTDGILLHSRFDSWFAMYQKLQSWVYCYPLEGGTLLHSASEYNLISVVNSILTQNVCADQKDEDSRTPLSIAAEKGHEVLVELLINRDDVDADSKDFKGMTPFSWAAMKGHENVIQMLINRDDVNIDSKNHTEDTPLSLAASKGHEAIVKMLMNRDDVNIDSKNDTGETPLSLAASKGHEAIVKMLMNRDDVNIDSKNDTGDTPLSLAASKGHEAIVKMLMNRDDVNIDSKNHTEDTPLSLAALWGHEAIVKMLINRDDVNIDSKNHTGDTPLSLAASRGHEAVVKMLMNRDDVDVDSRNLEGCTPFSMAVELGAERVAMFLISRGDVDADSKDCRGDTPLIKAGQSGLEAIIELLIKRNDVDVNWRNHRGESLFSEAAEFGSKATVEMLLERGVDLSSKNGQLTTALFGASANGYHEIVTLLLRHNADVNATDNKYRTPLSWAANWGRYKVVELLLLQGSDSDQKDGRDRTPLSYAAGSRGVETVKLLLERSDVNVDSKDHMGRTPLSYAAAGRRGVETVKLLLERSDVNVDSKDHMGRTPLSYAAAGRRGVETVKLLLERSDVNVDSKDHMGRTPLSRAAENETNETVNLLLERSDINVDSKDFLGRTPLSYAAGSGGVETVKLLLERSDVNVNSKDTDDRTPLSYAVESGNEKSVILLVERSDVDVNSKDTSGISPLIWALDTVYFYARTWRQEHQVEECMRIVDLLLNRHDISPRGKDRDALVKYFLWRKANGYTYMENEKRLAFYKSLLP